MLSRGHEESQYPIKLKEMFKKEFKIEEMKEFKKGLGKLNTSWGIKLW